MKTLEQFYTRPQANEGKKLPLSLPDGSPSDHYLVILGVDSDEFEFARHKAQQQLVELKVNEDLDDKKIFDETKLIKTKLIATLIKDWSFTDDDGKPLPCTKDAVVEFLTNAPQIAETVDTIACDRDFFLIDSLESSENTQEQSSTSTDQLKEEKSPKDKHSTKSGNKRGRNRKG